MAKDLWGMIHKPAESKIKEPLLVLSEGKVLLLHQQNQLNETLSLNWKRNEQLSTSAVGEAIASKPTQHNRN